MSERTRPTEIPKRTVTRGIATVAALLMAGGVGGAALTPPQHQGQQ